MTQYQTLIDAAKKGQKRRELFLARNFEFARYELGLIKVAADEAKVPATISSATMRVVLGKDVYAIVRVVSENIAEKVAGTSVDAVHGLETLKQYPNAIGQTKRMEALVRPTPQDAKLS